MSSYKEFKQDVSSLATGIFIFLLISLALQVTFLIVACLATLLLIGISRLFSGKKVFREYLIKLYVILFLGGMAAGMVIWGFYNYLIYPYYIKKERPNAAQETREFMDKYYGNDPGYQKAKSWKPLDNGYKGYDNSKNNSSQ
jgi:hypothetical protein